MHVISHRKLKEFYESPGMEDSKVALENQYEYAMHCIRDYSGGYLGFITNI